MFDLKDFISTHITHRETSMFLSDLERHHFQLYDQIRGRSVLVIGGAGTIGSSFIKALLPFQPGALTVVDHNENGLTELTRDLRSSWNELMPSTYITYPFNFGGVVFPKLFQNNTYDIVACFAAHKHVRSEKDHLAIEAMIRNNVFNTRKLLDHLKIHPPEHVFAVSTDKATNPVNVMGASKLLMEKLLLSYANELPISTARFANVAFSNGSLLHGFEERMAKQQPLSAPRDVRRYFVSPEEAGHLCLIACMGGSSGEIFFPKLQPDEMTTFAQIAKDYLTAHGFQAEEADTEEDARNLARAWKPDSSRYPVYFFDINTSGEKLFEEFYSESDRINLDQFEALGIIETQSNETVSDVEQILGDLERVFARDTFSKAEVIAVLAAYLPGFSHVEKGRKLDDGL